MKIITILLASLFSLTTFSQKNDSYKTFDGSTFTIGDTITIGTNTGYEAYNSIREYYYNSKYSKGYKNVNYLIENKKLPIKKIYQNTDIFNKQKIIIKVGEKGLLKTSYYIDIESAVQNGEVIVKSVNKTELISINMSEILAFSNYHVLSKKTISDDQEEYLYRFQQKLYNKTREDEFEYNSALKESSTKFKKLITVINPNIIYSTNTKLNLQKYDFENEGFPLNDKNIEFKLYNKITMASYGSKEDYQPLFLHFDNFKNFAFLQYPPEEAKSFVKRKKDVYGNIDRTIYLKIFYKINGVSNSTDKIQYLNSEILKIEVYEFESFHGNFLGEIYDLTK